MARAINYHNVRDNKGRFAPRHPNSPSRPKKHVSEKSYLKISDRANALPLTNNVLFCIDGSGSMCGLEHQLARIVNDWIETLRNESYNTGQKTNVSLVCFDTYVTQRLTNEDCLSVRQVTYLDVYMGGMTALYDAVNDSLTTLQTNEAPNATSLLIVATDGHENASRRINGQNFLHMMIRASKNPNMTLVFLVPSKLSKSKLESMGVPSTNIQIWENTEQGLQEVHQSVTSGIQGYYQSRSVGETSMTGFFAK